MTDGNVQIIGRLNKPYGEITRVRGIWHHNSPEVSKEDGAFSFGIVNIDGRDLFGPDQILIPGIFISNWNEDDDRMPIEDGDVFEGPVFESGRYVRAPLEVYKIVGEEDKLARADVFSFGFYSFLYLIRNEPKTSK